MRETFRFLANTTGEAWELIKDHFELANLINKPFVIKDIRSCSNPNVFFGTCYNDDFYFQLNVYHRNTQSTIAYRQPQRISEILPSVIKQFHPP